MPRRKLIYTNEHPYHIYARSNNKDWFCLPMEDCYFIFAEVLEKTIKEYNIRLHAFVLMSNHFHMLISTPEKNLSQSMRYFMTEVSRRMGYQSQRINHVFGARYGWTLISSAEHYWYCYRYVYQNPLRAGIVSKIEHYPWSTITHTKSKMHNLLSKEKIGHESLLPSSEENILQWLNQLPENDLSENIRLALRRSIFEFKADRRTQKMPI